MIENDFGRSFEFIASPYKAGQDAKNLPFSTQTITAIFLFCAIISVLISIITSWIIPIEPPKVVTPNDAPSIELQLNFLLLSTVEFFQKNPLYLMVITATLSLSSAFAISVIGGKFSPITPRINAMSALARFEIFITFSIGILQIIAILFWILSASAGSAFSGVVSLCALGLIILKIHVINGIFELSSFLRALGIYFLSGLALSGIAFMLSLIILVAFL